MKETEKLRKHLKGLKRKELEDLCFECIIQNVEIIGNCKDQIINKEINDAITCNLMGNN